MIVFNRAYKIFFNAILLVVYTSFFTVQFFFNFDIASNTRPSFINPFSGLVVKNHQASEKKAGQHGSHKTNFRLNKRFHPQALPVCNTICAKAPVQYISSENISRYNKVFIHAVILINHSLRGPPVVA
jgi:hypothetical protein